MRKSVAPPKISGSQADGGGKPQSPSSTPKIAAKSGAPILLSFAAPDYGIMFRCRVVCPPSESVATAAVTGLRFLEMSLNKANIERVTLCMDSPTYYFQVTGQTAVTASSAVAGASGARAEMLQKYREKYKLEFELIERVNNPARHNCHGFPTTPADVDAPLVYNPVKWPQKGKMMSLQNGIKL